MCELSLMTKREFVESECLTCVIKTVDILIELVLLYEFCARVTNNVLFRESFMVCNSHRAFVEDMPQCEIGSGTIGV